MQEQEIHDLVASVLDALENATSVSRSIRWARWKAFRNAIGAKALDWFGGRVGTFGGNR